MNDYLNILQTAAMCGGNELKRYFGTTLKARQKSTAADLQTVADRSSERAIMQVICGMPVVSRFNIISEETGPIQRGSEHTIVIDPLDGTHNFTLGIPYFAVAIALVHAGNTIASVVYAPMLDHMYTAEKRKGAFLNGNKIQVNQQTDVRRASVSFIRGYEGSLQYARQVDDMLINLGVKRRLQLWCPALDFCLLASGKIEAVINVNPECYDVVPGKFIAREAGAHIVGFDGKLDQTSDGSRFIASCTENVGRDMLVSALK